MSGDDGEGTQGVTEARWFETILVATDFSPTADRALEAARELVLAAGSGEIVLAHAKFVPREKR